MRLPVTCGTGSARSVCRRYRRSRRYRPYPGNRCIFPSKFGGDGISYRNPHTSSVICLRVARVAHIGIDIQPHVDIIRGARCCCSGWCNRKARNLRRTNTTMRKTVVRSQCLTDDAATVDSILPQTRDSGRERIGIERDHILLGDCQFVPFGLVGSMIDRVFMTS